MVRSFEEEVAEFKLKKVEVTTEPVKTEFGYHIIKKAG
jgi:peptidyl-prolyl cis-trans isomerase C